MIRSLFLIPLIFILFSCSRIEEKWQDVELATHHNQPQEALTLCYKLLERELDVDWRFRIQKKVGFIQHYLMRDPQKAVFAYRQALELTRSPAEVVALIKLIASVYEELLQHHRQAITEYQRLLYLYPDMTEASQIQFKIASLWEELGDYRQAFLEYQKLENFKSGPEMNRKRDYKMGQMFLLQQKYKEALTQYQKFVKKYPDTPEIQDAWFDSAICYEQLGELKKALATLKGVKKYSRPEILQQRIQRLEARYRLRKR